ncbi:MAG TPA: septation protein IspZ [Aeromonadales bacterium]|nr:septation protein IspZ [Aeromonadales bacterium]
MSFLIDFFPLGIFFTVYKLSDIYLATAFLIAASVIQLGIYRYKAGKFEKSKIILFLMIITFGGLTLALHNDAFIKWKVTILCIGFASAFFLSARIKGRQTLIERFLRTTGEDFSAVPPQRLRLLNNFWTVSYLMQAAANHYFAFYQSQASWVNFKVWGLTAVNLVMIVVSLIAIAPYLQDDKSSKPKED